MDKGIRPECNRKFNELLPTRENTRAGNTAFRKTVMAHVMQEFGITLASAATHYNHAFIDAREKAKTDAALATLLVGLGRPEDKKGGRKKKEVPAATPAATTDAAPAGDTPASTDAPQGDAPAADATPEVKYSVSKKDGTIVCSDLTLAEANALIDKAKAAKKGTLVLVPPAEAVQEAKAEEAAPAADTAPTGEAAAETQVEPQGE